LRVRPQSSPANLQDGLGVLDGDVQLVPILRTALAAISLQLSQLESAQRITVRTHQVGRVEAQVQALLQAQLGDLAGNIADEGQKWKPEHDVVSDSPIPQ